MRIKGIMLTMLFALMLFCTACEAAGTNEGLVLNPDEKGNQPSITIVMNVPEYANFRFEKLDDYTAQFEKSMGVKVNIDIIKQNPGRFTDAEDEDAYMKELSTRLYMKDGPELIFTEYFYFKQVIEQNAVEELDGKVSNIDKLYRGLLQEKNYYVPIGMSYYCFGINNSILKELDAPEPDLNWTQKDYFRLWDQWIETAKPYFNAAEYNDIYNRYIQSQLNLKYDRASIDIDIPTVIAGIKNARGLIYGGSYRLHKDYRYQNYYNMMFVEGSKESTASQELYDANKEAHIRNTLVLNGFRVDEIMKKSKANDAVIFPQYSNEKAYVSTCGFLVNKNSKNKELAYEFINGLLSDEEQWKLFDEGGRYYPVSKAIESEVLNIEAQRYENSKAVELKKFLLNQLDNGRCETDAAVDAGMKAIKEMLRRDLSKYMLSDEEYSDDELKVELKKLTDKYNVWLSE